MSTRARVSSHAYLHHATPLPSIPRAPLAELLLHPSCPTSSMAPIAITILYSFSFPLVTRVEQHLRDPSRVMLGLAMFAVTSGYSVSENVLFLWERRLLADREVEVNRLNTDCLLTGELQRHSESIIVMSHSQQQDGVI